MDFFIVATKQAKGGPVEIYPKFIIKKCSDLMIRGSDFYAVWIDELGLWSTDEQDAIDIVDRELEKYRKEHQNQFGDNCKVKFMWDAESGTIDDWHKYCQKQMRDNYVMLDEKIVFSNDCPNKKDYASKRLDYPLEEGDYSSWEKLISTLYSEEERHKIEWAIGSIVTGASKSLQKFMVLYGSAGTGKSTILNIIQKLFKGYCAVFDAKALGNPNSQFALESFKTNPLVAIQHDGDLSRIEDNTRLNSLVSHETMTVSEKYKSTYENDFKAFLLMGTNKPVKITDGKSGLLRRLIDVTPTGNKVSSREYDQCMKRVNFELGAIASHCKEVYLADPEYYDDYVPLSMMDATNDFYNFVVDSYSIFLKDDGTTLKAAWAMYKDYCEEARVPYPMSKRVFKEELKNYFKRFDESCSLEDGSRARSCYRGFRTDIFETEKKPEVKNGKNKPESWLEFRGDIGSVLDGEYADCLAQYANAKETPSKPWVDVSTTLSTIDTRRLHYVMVPDVSHIVIDFDIKDESGNKSFEKNLEAASKWPATYAELSKSGAGIHLHYIWTGGDPTLLERIYDENIEVKVFTGLSTLRRKLTKCNNLPIATLNSGLSVKGEKKVLDKEVRKTEGGLRKTIIRSLNKEIHGYTKPEIDFIYKILEDAYNDGLKYDVSDMKNEIYAFAATSNNNSEYCLKVVSKMKFKSEEASLGLDNRDTPLVFYDIEVFPNLFLVNWKIQGPDKPMVRLINPTPAMIEDMMQYKLVGFNCRRYDNHLIYACLMGYSVEQLYNLSQKIISAQKGERNNGLFGEAYNLSYTDVYDFASAGNKKSLKKLEIEMSTAAQDPNSKMSDETRALCSKIKHHELGLPWDQPVDESLWDKVAEYCDDDVYATEAAFSYLEADWTARKILASLANMTVNDTTNTLTTKFIFGSNRKPQNEFCYRNLGEPVSDLDEEVYQLLAEACPEMMSKTHGEAGSLLPYFPGYKYENGKSTYRGEETGEGGYVFANPGIHRNVALLDIASMHPHSTIAECLFGPRYTKAYRDVVEGRVSIKHEAWGVVNDMLDGKLTPYVQQVINGEMSSSDLANALKTAINSVYGLTSANFDNPFRDIRNKDNIVAKRGALFMIDLKHEVMNRGFNVAHIKTDSIKIPDATPEIIEFCMKFARDYGYTFEHEATYEKMCLVNDAVYIAKYASEELCKTMYGYLPGDNKKHPGDWTATGKQFAVPYTFKTLFSHEPVVFSDLCETFAVSKGSLYLDMNENLPDVTMAEKELFVISKPYTTKAGEEMPNGREPERQEELKKIIEAGHDLKFVGRVGQFCPIKPGYGGGVLYRVDDGKNYSAAGAKGYRWLESDVVKTLGLEDHIDLSFYDNLAQDAVDNISKYGDFEKFISDDPYRPDFMYIPDTLSEEIPFV